MKSIVIGTAGHIDHGKTALVKALTGIDADRLEEEKRRGITIDLGFAHMELTAASGEKLKLAFVDVPGHERFVRNMLAGVGGIDLALLVIAANESIKPQTREHFEILQLLGVRRGITVLTKADLVDSDTLGTVRLEVDEYLRGTFLEAPKSPVVAVSAHAGAGLDELKRAIFAVAGGAPSRDPGGLVRLPIDRVFTMKGFGTVVTGTLISGAIHCDDELEALPAGRRVRVRGIQVHGESADTAIAGQRTALNLAGAAVADLSRGMTLAPVDTFVTTREAEVQLRLLPSAARPLRNRTRVHFHSGTMETVAEVVIAARTAGTKILPGEQAYARIKLPEKNLLVPGDRFILRQFSPLVTIGGGVVLDAAPVQKSSPTASLDILASGDARSILMAKILDAAATRNGITVRQLVAKTGWTREFIEPHLAQLEKDDQALRIGDLFLDRSSFENQKNVARNALADFLHENPLSAGINQEELKERTHMADGAIFRAALDSLITEGKIEVAGEVIKLPGRGIVMRDEEAESKQKIEAAFATAGLKVPPLGEVLDGLKIDRVRAQKIVTLLLREKVLVKISSDMVFHATALQSLRAQIEAYRRKSATINVAQFKELTDVSRKYAIPLLEYLDRAGVTQRLPDDRRRLR